MAEIARLLLVEDDSVDVIAIRRALTTIGFSGQIVHAHSVFEARQVIQDAAPELILLDLNMPGHSGFELLDFLQSMHQRQRPGALAPPVVVLTSSSDASEKERCFLAGVVGYFVKPVAWQDLLETLRNIIGYWGESHRPVAS